MFPGGWSRSGIEPSARLPLGIEAPAPGTKLLTLVAATLTEKTARLTASPVNYWAGFLVDVAGIALFVALGLRANGHAVIAMWITAACGWVAWTLWEYYVHRFLFHETWSPFAHGHLAHHAMPRRTIGLPFFVAFTIAVALYAGCRVIMPAPYPSWFVAGAYLGWLYYGVLHHVEHATDLSLAGYRRLRRHHLLHHGVMTTNFGVSTTVWDRLFGTHLERPRASRRDVS